MRKFKRISKKIGPVRVTGTKKGVRVSTGAGCLVPLGLIGLFCGTVLTVLWVAALG